MRFKELLTYFPDYRKNANGSIQAHCPHHADNEASLTITDMGDKALMHCHAGCSTEDILSDIGLSMKDLFYNEISRQSTWFDRMTYGLKKNHSENGEITKIYDYRDEKGKYLYSKIRFEWTDTDGKRQKVTPYRVINRKTDSYSTRLPDGMEQTLYNLPKVLWAISKGKHIYFVEGEKDVDNLAKLGRIATTAGSASGWRKEYARYFTGAKVSIIPDNDEPGIKLAKQIMNDIRPFAFWRECLPVLGGDKKGYDISDYIEDTDEEEAKTWLDHHSSIMEQTEAKEGGRQYPPWVKATIVYDKAGDFDKVKISIIADVLADTIRDHVPLLVIRNPSDDKDRIYRYKDGVYKLGNKQDLSCVIGSFLPLGTQTTRIIDETGRLLLAMAKKEVHAFIELDENERYINIRNGLYDLEAGELIKHDSRLLSTLQFNAEYRPMPEGKTWRDVMPNFYKFITDLCTDDTGQLDGSRYAITQEYIGFVLSNVSVKRIKKIGIFYSPIGNTGKSTLSRLLCDMIGNDGIASGQLQDLAEKNKFLLGSLFGKRLFNVGDQSGTKIEDSSALKYLSGGDVSKFERKNKDLENGVYRGVMMISCNLLPYIADDNGEHVFNRFLIIPCDNPIPEDKRDKNLDSKIWKERDFVFLWALEGLKRLKANNYNFSPCAASEKVARRYRQDIDPLYLFITSVGFQLTGNRKDVVSKVEFDSNFLNWCAVHEVGIKKKNIESKLARLGVYCDENGSPDFKRGKKVYHKIKYPEIVVSPEVWYGDEETPFDDEDD